MCGINGFYSLSLSNFNNAISKMNSAISHRGPDSNGSWQDSNVGIFFGHQRLSILDLSTAGNQPMRSISGQFIITYNGEIYNHLEIREEIEKKNSDLKWRSNSDTETLLEAIGTWGIDTTLKKIEGMFAFGIWDRKKRSLILARDRIGEKPLYFGWQGEGNNKIFIFSSELKALKVHPGFNADLNKDAITLQLRHNCIPAPHSIYKNIYKLLPGHYLQIHEHELKKAISPSIKSYWSISNCAIFGANNQLRENENKIINDLENNLKKSVKKQMISDVPIGAFLSGGIDSSTIAALMQSQSNNPINTFTIGFQESDYSEANYAKEIAKHLGTNHTNLFVSSQKALDIIPKLPIIYDEPFSDSSQIPTFIVSQLTSQHVKVALSGDGGDELFCGYNRYIFSKKFSNFYRFVPTILRKALSSLILSISPKKLNILPKFMPILNHYVNFGDRIHKGANALKVKDLSQLYYFLTSHWQNPKSVVIDSSEPGTFLNEFKPDLSNLNFQEQMMVLDCLTYLPDDILVKIDRAAMASSIETRIPFLDHKLIEYVFKIPHNLKYRDGQGKWILRKILKKYIPEKLTERPKRGFEIPLDLWLRGPLREWAENLLNEKRIKQENYFNPEQIRNKWKEHLSEKKNWQYDLWDILMFQAWLDKNS